MSVFVFVGPSSPIASARGVLDAVYLPPIELGDVLRLLPRRPRAIGILDGHFFTRPAVWHKELLHALGEGVAVFGASQLGALRACELSSFGMTGVGRVFEGFRDGILEDDDEVFAQPSHVERSERADTMVNIREGVRRAVDDGIISEESARKLLGAAKRTFYTERSWSALLARGDDLGVPAPELRALRHAIPTAPDLQLADAVAMLRAMREYLETSTDVAPQRHFEPTRTWYRLLDEEEPARLWSDGGSISLAQLGRHVRLHVDDEDLFGRAAVACGLTRENRASPALDRWLAADLERKGALADLSESVRAKWTLLEASGVPEPGMARIDLAEASAWYEEHFRTIAGSVVEHSAELGFRRVESFVREVFAEFLLSRRST